MMYRIPDNQRFVHCVSKSACRNTIQGSTLCVLIQSRNSLKGVNYYHNTVVLRNCSVENGKPYMLVINFKKEMSVCQG